MLIGPLLLGCEHRRNLGSPTQLYSAPMSPPEQAQQQPADISSRVWIRWGDGEPYENTTTLVLTTPSQTFIDIRVLQSSSQTTIGEQIIDVSLLEWAFSGIATTEYRDGICHKTWTHHIDSRSAYGAEPPIDEGDMYPEPDGVLCRERGRMVNPETGEMSDYEEMWETIEAHTTGSDTRKWCLVATTSAPEHKARGMLIRIGQFVQCLLIVDDEVNVERWVYTDAGEGSQTGEGSPEGWARTIKLGARTLPCPRFFRAEACQEGRTLEDAGQLWSWTVTEKASW